MLNENKQMSFTYYTPLYDELIPKDHFFRQVKELIDFSFANDLLKGSYCEKFGRPAREPEFMLKLLFLQRLKNLSDREVVEEASYNLAYKFFLDLSPEEKICDPSLLSKFRRKHIATEYQLKQLLNGILGQAAEKGLLKDAALILAATHTKSRSTKENNTEQLKRLTKNIRRVLYQLDPEIKARFPQKPGPGADFGQELSYTKKLIKVIDKEDQTNWSNRIKKEYQHLKRHMEMIKEAENSMPKKGDQAPKKTYQESQVDPDAKTGYKSENNSFFGYKSHIAMTEDRIITGIHVTSGEDSDGKHLERLIDQSRENHVTVKEVLADCAYGSKENLEYLEKEEITGYIRSKQLVSKNTRLERQGMIYNKDADTLQCRGGELAIKKTTSIDRGAIRHMYWFDVEKCKRCPYREACYKPGSKTRTFSVKEREGIQSKHLEFEETEGFRERIKERYKIEAKNGEMKTSHGMEHCIYRGLFGMQVQAYMTGITVDIKRFIKMLREKAPKKPGLMVIKLYYYQIVRLAYTNTFLCG
ncbi:MULTISPECIES: IS1182 family transposase [Hungatella]|nr:MULTISPECIES: IS1182 family transposase [Hungatella]MCQ4833169.1 IS1182 family transposase [Hungatella sp. SL.1.14]CUQ44376.1 transposase [Hungatella hathewayi]